MTGQAGTLLKPGSSELDPDAETGNCGNAGGAGLQFTAGDQRGSGRKRMGEAETGKASALRFVARVCVIGGNVAAEVTRDQATSRHRSSRTKLISSCEVIGRARA